MTAQYIASLEGQVDRLAADLADARARIETVKGLADNLKRSGHLRSIGDAILTALTSDTEPKGDDRG